MAGRTWTRDETLAAFALYCRLPFGRLHGRNAEIIAVANKLGRTPSAVAMKCCNLASLDETHQARGITALANVSNLDRSIWAEFQADPDAIGFQAASALAALEDRPVLPPSEVFELPTEGRERERVVRVRVNQRFFRELILAGYSESCAVCQLPLPALLVAAHIVPWSVDATLRMNPRNGLCLCGTHDLAFEHGHLRIYPDFVMRIEVPQRLHNSVAVRDWLLRFDGRNFQPPQRWLPDPALLERKLALPRRTEPIF